MQAQPEQQPERLRSFLIAVDEDPLGILILRDELGACWIPLACGAVISQDFQMTAWFYTACAKAPRWTLATCSWLAVPAYFILHYLKCC